MRNKKLHRWRWGLWKLFLKEKMRLQFLKKNGKYGVYFKQEGFNAARITIIFLLEP